MVEMNLLYISTTTKQQIYSRILQNFHGGYQHQQQRHHGCDSSKFWLGDMLLCLEIHGPKYHLLLSPLKEKAALKWNC